MTSIGDYAFSNCSGLASISIPGNVTNIGSGAFSYCYNLTTATLQEGVTSIGDNAFSYCSRLANMTIPSSMISIGSYAFSNCSSITNVTIKEGVTSIGEGAFSNCSRLTSISFPLSATYFSKSVCSGCRSLTSISIAESVTSIQAEAFRDCSSLTTIRFLGAPPSISGSAFTNITANAYYLSDKGWTSANMKNYGGNLTWIPDTTKDLVAAFVQRGYSLILGREADADGLKFYVDLLTSGQLSGAQMVSNFMYSPEFSDKNYPSEQVVRIVYQTMLNREPDADGLRYHIANLDRGISYNSLINNFSGSEEFAGICGQSGITPGMVEPEWRERNPGVTAFVARNYELTLGRVAGGSELNYYCQILLEKTLTPQQVAHNFVFSPECVNRGLSDRAFIEMLYHLYMDRDADAGGLNYYLNALSGSTSRKAVDAGFGNSPEFQTIVQCYGL